MYEYSELKPRLFTDEGQRQFLRIRDRTFKLLNQAGAVRMQGATAHESGDSWFHLACVDRLVELKEIEELTHGNVCGQHRVFVKVSEL